MVSCPVLSLHGFEVYVFHGDRHRRAAPVGNSNAMVWYHLEFDGAEASGLLSLISIVSLRRPTDEESLDYTRRAYVVRHRKSFATLLPSATEFPTTERILW